MYVLATPHWFLVLCSRSIKMQTASFLFLSSRPNPSFYSSCLFNVCCCRFSMPICWAVYKLPSLSFLFSFFFLFVCYRYVLILLALCDVISPLRPKDIICPACSLPSSQFLGFSIHVRNSCCSVLLALWWRVDVTPVTTLRRLQYNGRYYPVKSHWRGRRFPLWHAHDRSLQIQHILSLKIGLGAFFFWFLFDSTPGVGRSLGEREA